MLPVYWIVIAVVLLFIEFITMGLTTIWFAGGAAAAFLTALLGFPLPVQVGVFIAVSVVLVVFTRPLAARYLNSRTTRTNVESLVGKTALVTEAISNRKAAGQVQVDGVSWTARSVSGEEVPVGEAVRICRIQGVKLMVERLATNQAKREE